MVVAAFEAALELFSHSLQYHGRNAQSDLSAMA
jgi:hypothetical protein